MLSRLATALLIAAPPVGVALFAGLALVARRVVRVGWWLPFGTYAVVLGLYAFGSGSAAPPLAAALGGILLLAVAIVVVPPDRGGVAALALGGVLLVALIPVEAWIDATTWRPYASVDAQVVGLRSDGPVQRIVAADAGPAARRSFLVDPGGGVRIDFGVRGGGAPDDATTSSGDDAVPTVTAELDWAGRSSGTTIRRRVALDGAWHDVTLEADAATLRDSPFVIVRLYLPDGVPAVVRPVRATGLSVGEASPRPAIGEWRPALFFGDRNLLAHAMAVSVLVVLAVARSWRGRILASLPFLVIIAATGSRSAWLGILVGGGLVAIASARGGRRARGPRAAWLVPGTAIVALAATWLTRAGLVAEQTPRGRIFAAAWRAFVEHPWRGLHGAGEEFGSYWSSLAGTADAEVVFHAHNSLLQAAALYGMAGLVAMTVVFAGYVVLAWRSGRLVGLGLVAGALTMAMLDDTFLSLGVQLPLIWGVNALAAEPPRRS